MDKAHTKRFVILASTTLAVIILSIVGLVSMNDQMQKAIVNARNNVSSSSISEGNNSTNDLGLNFEQDMNNGEK